MTDYRDPNDPFYRNAVDEAPQDKNNRGGIIAGVLFLLIVAGLALGVGHEPGQVASNDATPSATPSLSEDLCFGHKLKKEQAYVGDECEEGNWCGTGAGEAGDD
jgi:hypothetical protein